MDNWFGNFGTLPQKATSQRLNELKENREFCNHFSWLCNLALKEFITEGLPPTLDHDLIEYCFLYRGKCGAVDMYGKPFAMSISPYNTLTFFGKPAKGQAFAMDGTNRDVTFYWEYLDNKDESTAVFGLDNETGYPFINYIIDRAEQLAEAYRAIQTAAKLSKLSGVVKIPEEQKNAVIKMLNDYNNNLPFLVVATKKGGLPLDIDVMNFSKDAGLIKDLWDNYNNLLASTLQMFGINCNSNSDKKERMTVAEVKGNMNIPEITEEIRIEKRQEFYDLINKKWGTNITVKSRYAQPETENAQVDEEASDEEQTI